MDKNTKKNFAEQDTLKSVEHALTILELFDSEHPLYSMTEIAQKAGLHPSTAYRLVRVLLRRGYLERRSDIHKYGLGFRLVELASSRINTLELVSEAHPLLVRMHKETSFSSQLCVLDGTDVIYLDEVSGTTAPRHINMGYRRGEAYCSSMGKCLLAAHSGEELDWMFANYKFTRYTDTTITSYEALKAELRTVRRQGYALNRGEREPFMTSLACPIYDYSGDIVAAASAGGVTFQLEPQTINSILPHLRRYTMMISKRLGYAASAHL